MAMIEEYQSKFIGSAVERDKYEQQISIKSCSYIKEVLSRSLEEVSNALRSKNEELDVYKFRIQGSGSGEKS